MVDDQVDEGSPIGGISLAAGLISFGLLVVQLPAMQLGIGWLPGTLAILLAPVALLSGGFSIISEDSPRGRRNAFRGTVLGLLTLLGEIVLALDALVPILPG